MKYLKFFFLMSMGLFFLPAIGMEEEIDSRITQGRDKISEWIQELLEQAETTLIKGEVTHTVFTLRSRLLAANIALNNVKEELERYKQAGNDSIDMLEKQLRQANEQIDHYKPFCQEIETIVGSHFADNTINQEQEPCNDMQNQVNILQTTINSQSTSLQAWRTATIAVSSLSLFGLTVGFFPQIQAVSKKAIERYKTMRGHQESTCNTNEIIEFSGPSVNDQS